MTDYRQTQIIINNRDRLSTLKELIDWLVNAGYTDISVLDNDSTFLPLIQYYDEVASDGTVKFYPLGKNLLSKALWAWSEGHSLVKPPFVYSDSDVVPDKDCPTDVIEFLSRVANHLGNPYKVGLGLRIDDIPEHYSQAKKVLAWESQMWTRIIGTFEGVELYSAGVDTTFALYPAFRPFQLNAVRTGYPYVARHLPWYADSQNPTPEQLYYEQHAAKGCHNWATDDCFSIRVNRYCEEQKST